MDDWWAEIETTVRAALRQQDELSVDEVATALGVPGRQPRPSWVSWPPTARCGS